MRAMGRVSCVVSGLLLLAGGGGGRAAGEDLASYAQKCKDAIGVDVHSFDCTKGFPVPVVPDPTNSKQCATPPYLSSATCRAGSRLGVQDTGNPDVAIVWLCRKKKIDDPNSSTYDDVAVIQTNFKNGATCFYQTLDIVDGSNVPAPSDTTRKFWWKPKDAAGQQCASCHDTGFLRTPYLMQVKDKDKPVLPTRRHTTEYWFPGEDFKGWNGKVFRIKETGGATCTTCHAMGANLIDPTDGTSAWLGLRATGQEKTELMTPVPTYGQHASWMGKAAWTKHHPDPTEKAQSVKMAECAAGTRTDCCQVLWGGQMKAILDELLKTPLPRIARPSEGREPSQRPLAPPNH